MVVVVGDDDDEDSLDVYKEEIIMHFLTAIICPRHFL